MARVEIRVPAVPTPAMREAILSPLAEHNARVAGPSGYEPAAVLLIAADTEQIVGGLWGTFSYDWLFIELLAVPQQLRGASYGTMLMREAERIAAARGAVGIWLDTFSFQARGFYVKLGYAVFGELPDHPRGGARYFMQKRLAGLSAR